MTAIHFNMHIAMKYVIFLMLAIFPAALLATPASETKPVGLMCELRTEPVGIDLPNPGFSYTLTAANKNERGWKQSGYQIVVASSPALLQDGKADLWNSGEVRSDKMAYITYEGKPLRSSKKYWWKVRVWDGAGKPSAWSLAASFTTGVLHQNEWTASWITTTGADGFALSPFGFRAQTSAAQTGSKWVQVDLGKTAAVDEVSLTPVFFQDRAGWGFPQNFKIEVANDADFKNSTTLADYSTQNFKNPGWKTVRFPARKLSARYVRLTANSFWGWAGNFQFALRQIQVFANGKNIASGKRVTASDADNTDGWQEQNLTDEPEDRASLPNYSSLLLRKEFAVNKTLVHAVIHVSGLSEYELSINGKKVGDCLLTPGWTDYRKTVLYDTYEVTKQLQRGANAVGIFLGNGMYNIQPDSVRYVKFLNSFGPLKAVAQLQLTYADGSVQTIGTDASWQAAPGPITYSNVFGGEDYNANLETSGWNKASQTTNHWTQAIITTGPGGQLKGLSAAAAAIKAMAVLKPVSIKKLTGNVCVYDFGQNASMMPRITVSGERGARVRMIPAELLDANGYADRRSATQDGVRPAWWQYTLSGGGAESYAPKFFYQGARYLQVELYPAEGGRQLPQVKNLEDQVVHSSSTAIGNFACSNDLFNRIYKLVRWAQRSNMQSYMTDCPHREKLGWLEENHLNGPALRYNFDMALLFRKAMNDMADAQLPNGCVPNIAPEYFIAGSPSLNNPFRVSVEWGSSFIIVPWQQYLFSGDISLLERYYQRMKAYVAFLAATARNGIIQTGLGDWYDIGPKPAWGSQLTQVSFTATAVFYYDNVIMQSMAERLGKKEDAEKFKAAGIEIREAFNNQFYNAHTGLYATGSNTTCAMPLFFNLAAPAYRDNLIKALVDSIRGRGNSFTSGEVGYRFLLRALADAGYSNVVYAMNNQTERPGYGYQLKMGATSLTEKWDAGVGDFGSQNHFMSGQINEWFFSDLIGISPDENGPGFRKFTIKPSIVSDLSWVSGSVASISGNISAAWKKGGSKLSFNVRIPPNTVATVYVPSVDGTVTESGKKIKNSESLKLIRHEKGYSVFAVGSGTYQFNSTLSSQ